MRGTFQQGGQVGDYQLLRRLAAGGMGEIWLAERQGISGFSKRVVIKTILECFAEEPSLVDMFLDEGRIAAGLTHPNIAQTYDLGEIGRTYYIAMEYIQGRDLRNLLVLNVERGQLLPLNLVLRIIAETCEGLYYAHSWKTPDGRHAGIIHRDISPQNVLVTFDGKVKIIDFGIAKAAQSASRTRSGVLKGKYAYMSPEQVRGQRIDHRSDLFSLGVVMYELVTARRLFKRESELSTLDAVLKAEVPPPSRLDQSIPPEIEAVLLKALAQNKNDRFANAREMQLAIEEVMLAAKLPASSAHMAAYMEELFEQDLEIEQEQEQASLSRLGRKMESLPGVGDSAPVLERTTPFAPGLDLDRSTDSHRRELTRNLLPSQSRYPRPAGAGNVWKWALVGVLALVVALGSWFLGSTLLENTDGQSSDAGAVVADPTPIPAPDAGEPVPATSHDAGAGEGPSAPEGVDAGIVADAGPPIGLDLGRPDRVQPSPPSGPGRLTLVTEPPSDIFLGRKKLGRGTLKNYRLKAGTYTLKVVSASGVSKTVKVKMRPGRSTSKKVAFRTGRLRIVVIPWANVRVDGKKIGQTPLAPLNLLEGNHIVELSNPSLGKNVKKTVKVRSGREELLRFDWR